MESRAIFQAETQAEIVSIELTPRPIFALDIHPDGTRFATGGIGADSATGRVAIWNMQPLLSTKVWDRFNYLNY